jgi:pyruvate,orthophosphate dikinase
VGAVFDSWDTPRAKVYRRANDIPDDLGTAVNVVQMVFGNKGDRSGTGVVFTRNPSTGEKEVYGEYLQNAQGEDVVAGIRTRQPVEDLGSEVPGADDRLRRTLPAARGEHYRDACRTRVHRGGRSALHAQTRAAKRTAAAALKAAVDMVEEGLISREEAVVRIDPAQLDQLLPRGSTRPRRRSRWRRGLNASPGAASGGIVFDADAAEEKAKGGPVILVRYETTPDDIHGMIAAQGILTVHGGMTSHRRWSPAGWEAVRRRLRRAGDRGRSGAARRGELREGDVITIDGGSGAVYLVARSSSCRLS